MWLDTAQKFTLIEVDILNGSDAKHKFPNDDILREKKVTGIFVLGRDGSNNGKGTLDKTVISDQAISEGYLTFKCDNAAILENMPLQFLHVDSADKRVLRTDLTGITPTKSFITFADTASINTNEVVRVGIFYED